MSQNTTVTVQIDSALSTFVTLNVGDGGRYGDVSAYVSDLIRRDKERAERESFNYIKAELKRAFEAPDDSYRPVTLEDVIKQDRDYQK